MVKIGSAKKVIGSYHSIRAHVFFPTFENSPKIEFFANGSSNFALSISKREKILSCLIDVKE